MIKTRVRYADEKDMAIRSIRNPSPLPPEPTGEERRQKGRLKCGLLLCELGQVINMSGSGLRVLSTSNPRLKDGTRLTLTLQAQQEKATVRVEVLWSKHVSAGRYELGAKFVEVSDELASNIARLARTTMAQGR